MSTVSPTALRPNATAALLSLTVQRLAKMRLDGGGPPYVKVGRSILYRREDLDAWLASRTQRSTSEATCKGA